MAHYTAVTPNGKVEFDSPLSDLNKSEVEDVVNHMAPPPMTLNGLGQNAMSDIKGDIKSIPSTLSAMAMLPKKLLIDTPNDIYQSGKQVIQGGNISDTPIGQQAQQLGSMVKHLPDNIMHPYDHPVNAALDATGAFGAGAQILDGIRAASKAVALKVLPRALDKSAGIPGRATVEALNNPNILKQIAPTANEIQNKALNVVDALRQAKQEIGDIHGKIYRKYAGMESPKADIVNTPIAQGINPIKEDVPVSQQINFESSPNPENNMFVKKPDIIKSVPGKINTEEQTTRFSPGQRFAVTDTGNSWDKVLINKQDIDLAFKKNDREALVRLYKNYVGTSKSNILSSEKSKQDKLQILSRAKREASQYADFYNRPNPNTLVPIDSASSAAAKEIGSQINAIRSNLPNGWKLAVADKGWETLHQIYNDLQKNLSTPGTAEDTLFKLYKGDMSGITAGRTAEKMASIRRLESITGQKVLQPIYDAFTSREFNKGVGKGISHTLLSGGEAGSAITLAATGHPVGAAAALATMLTGSPKVLGLGIRGASALGTGINAVARRGGMSPLLAALLAEKSQ
jgi:hypothetical protein